MIVYLAGPINKSTDDEAMSWRERAKDVLQKSGIQTLDPMRRDYRGQEGDFVNTIVEGDLRDIRECDVMLVHAWKRSFGTAMEAWEASQHMDKDIVLVADADTSPWLKHCATRHFTSLPKALDSLT
jgi:hypothetical protein